MATFGILSDYVDRKTLAQELDVSPRTVSRYENLPDGLPSTTIGGRKLYRVQSVLEWIRKRERSANPRRR